MKSSNSDLLRQAATFLRAARLPEAKRLYQAVLAGDAGNIDAIQQLGVIARTEKDHRLSLEYLQRAIKLDGRRPAVWLSLALTQEDMGDKAAALDSLGRAVTIKPDFAEAWHNLGLLRRDMKQNAEAEQAFLNALRAKPDYARACNNLGVLLREQNRQAEAQEYFERAARLTPNDLNANFNVGANLQYLGRLTEAEAFFRTLVNLNPAFAPAWERLGENFRLLGKQDEAEKCLRHALSLQTGVNPENLNNLARILTEQGRGEEARATYAQASALDPGNLRAAMGAALTLSLIYPDAAAIASARKHYADGLADLRARSSALLSGPKEKILDTLTTSNFYLAYHGEDDRPLQENYAGFVHSILARITPELLEPPLATRRAGERIKVGFLSRHFVDSTAGKYFKSWVTGLDRDKFETHVYHLNEKQDWLTNQVQEAAAFFHALPRHRASTLSIANLVRQSGLDILIYPELGMDQVCFLLAALRLAPVQCMGWGHPVTSGHGTIDYYLSCATMEPPDAQDHYAEKLLLLPGLGTCYALPAVPAAGVRADFALPEGKTLYSCPQSLFKIHPENDDLLTDLVARDPDAVLLFFTAEHSLTTHQFVQRLGQAFERRNLKADGRFIILPRVGHGEYLRILQLCDVMLDTLHWSGGNTSLDALACGLPVVTLPGRFMRGRQSAGMLTTMGITELIAEDINDYLDIALRLGRDKTYRSEISARIRANLDRLFERDEPIQALQSLLPAMIDDSAGRG